MSKTPRPRKASRRREDAENARTLRELTFFIQRQRFQLGLAYVDTPKTRQTQLKKLEETVADLPVFVTTLNLAKYPGEVMLLQRLQTHLNDNPAPEGKTPSVMVIGLESLLDYEDLGPLDWKPQTILRNANVQRDAYSRLCPIPIVIWLLPVAARLLANEAPDFWHWRSGSFFFSGTPGERKELEFRHVEMPLLESQRLPTAAKRERLTLLQELLGNQEASDDRETRGAKGRRANLLHEIGIAHNAIAESRNAIKYFDRALELYREIGDRNIEGQVLGNLGSAFRHLGELRKAIAYEEQSLAIARETGNRRNEGQELCCLANSFASLGQTKKAIGYYEQTLSIARSLDDRHLERYALGNMGGVYCLLGESKKAMECLEQALVIVREIYDRTGEGQILSKLASAHFQCGELEKAVGYFTLALSIAREVGDRRTEGVILRNLSTAHLDLGNVDKAIELLEEARQIAQEIHDPRLLDSVARELNRLKSPIETTSGSDADPKTVRTEPENQSF